MSDLILRQDAILMIQRHGVGCFDADEFYPEEAERFVIGMLEKIQPAEPERIHDILDYTRYQVAWLKSHIDIELEPELENWIVRMLYDTAECYIKEHPELEIIHCKDCDWYSGNARCVHNDDLWDEDDYCSHAERRK